MEIDESAQPSLFPSEIIVAVTIAKMVLATWLLLAGWLLSKANTTVRIPVTQRNSVLL